MSIEKILLQVFHERTLSTGEVCRLTNMVCEAEDKLTVKLNEEQKELYRKFNDAIDSLHLQAIEEALLYGFRFGISLVNELKQIRKVNLNSYNYND
ncbi:MAG: hypothetical protein IJX00_01970 [Clostridia bacterium]|nr:hypothetical protein [Clostridia bacterium]